MSFENSVDHAAMMCRELQSVLCGTPGGENDRKTINLNQIIDQMHSLLRAVVRSPGQLEIELADHLPLVILDMNLPDTNGTRLLRDMRDLSPNIPCVIASATPEQELIAQCESCPPDDVLVKPFDKDSLIRTINRILRSSRAEQAFQPH